MRSSIILTLMLLMIFHQGNSRKYLVKTFEGKQKIVEVEKSAFHDKKNYVKMPKYSKRRKMTNKALMPITLTDSIDNQKIASEGKITNM